MAKIYIPHYNKCEFASLSDAIEYIRQNDYNSLCYILYSIVKYNITYRDHLRNNGVESLIQRFVEEAPQLKGDESMLEPLRKAMSKFPFADYDIQCYNIKDEITILGRKFRGLKDIKRHVELSGSCFIDFTITAPKKFKRCKGLHVGYLYEAYPVFDEDDKAYTRIYQNYIFRRSPITEADLIAAYESQRDFHFCMVNEELDVEMLPILHYTGKGDYMLLATAK